MPEFINRFILAQITLLLLGLFAHPVSGQVDLKALKKEADRYFENEKYFEALPNYKTLSREQPLDIEVRYRLAITNYHTHNIREALRLLSSLNENPKFSEDDYYYYLARCHHEKLEFRKAVEYYKEYLRSIPNSKDKERNRIKNAIRHCSNGMRIGTADNRIFVENLGDKVNAQGDDFRPVQSPTNPTRIYFSSGRAGVLGGMRGENGLEDPWTGYYRSDMYFTASDNGLWSKAEAMSYMLNGTDYDVVLDFSKDGSKMYYYQGPSLFQGGIYVDTFKTRKERSVFATPLKSPVRTELGDEGIFFFNDTILLFASDRTGGYGGLDLYITTVKQGRWTEPTNLGPTINTSYDETTPFLAKDGRTLYFSSNNGSKSIGGLDIFKAVFNDDSEEWSTPENLGLPINSPGDDMHFRLGTNGLKAFFDSDRKTGNGGRDIYAAYYRELQIENKNESVPLVFSEVTAYKGVLSVSGSTNTRPSEAYAGRPVTEYFLDPIYYEEDGTVLTSRNIRTLKVVSEMMTEFKQIQLVLISHSDGSEPERYDLFFSIKRAEQVAQFLAENGVALSNIYLKSVGKSHPIANSVVDGFPDPLGARLNRRIDLAFYNTSGLPVDITIQQPEITGPLSNSAWTYFNNSSKGLSYKIQIAETDQMYTSDLVLRYPNSMIEKLASESTYKYTVGLYQTFNAADLFSQELADKANEASIVPYIEGRRIEIKDVPRYFSMYPDLENFK